MITCFCLCKPGTATHILTPFHPLPNNSTSNTLPAIMPDWSVTFYDTLAEYVQAYIEAEEEVRAQILITCRDEITESPLLQEQEVELPTSLCLVGSYCPYHYLLTNK